MGKPRGNHRGLWYWLSIVNWLVGAFARRGDFGDEAQRQAQLALIDLGDAIYRFRYLLIALAIVVVTALIALINLFDLFPPS